MLTFSEMRRSANIFQSAWWGESFVNELSRISEQAQGKVKIRRGSVLDSKNNTQDGQADSQIPTITQDMAATSLE